MALLRASAAASAGDEPDPMVDWLVFISFVGNVTILVAKIVVLAFSLTLSVIGSSLDSLLDIAGGVIIYFSTRAAKKTSLHAFPAGRARAEPVAIVVLSAVMGMAGLLLAREAIASLAAGAPDRDEDEGPDIPSLAVLGINVVYKVTMAWLCGAYEDVSPSMGALAQDHFNDCLTNGAAILAVGLASAYPDLWAADPAFAILLGCYIIWSWVQEGAE